MGERIFNNKFIRVFLASFLFVAAGQIVMVMLPLYLDYLGEKPTVVGTATAFSALLALLMRPGSGAFADKKSKKWLMTIGIMLMMVGNIGFKFLPFAIAIILFRTIQGGGIAATTTAQMAIVVDVLPKVKMKQGLTLFSIAGTVGTAIGPIIGLKLGAGNQYDRVWYVGTGVFLIAILIILSLDYEKTMKKVQKIKPFSQDENWFWRIFEKTAFLPALVMVIVMISNTATIFLPSYGKEIGIKEIGLFYTIQSVVMFLTNFSLSYIIHKVKKILYLLVPALFSYFIGMVLLFMAQGDLYFHFAAAFYGIGIAATITIINTLVMSYAPEERRGAASATVQSAVDLGFGIGALLGGIVSGTFGYRSFYGLLVIFPVVALILGLYVFRHRTNVSRKENYEI